MKNKAWFLLFVLLCGSAATVSAFADDDASSFPGGDQQITNDQAETDRQDAIEAGQTCKADCVREETATCDARVEVMNKRNYHACVRKVAPLCERKCN